MNKEELRDMLRAELAKALNDGEEEEKPVEVPTEEVEAKTSVEELVKGIGEKVAEAIQGAKGGSEADASEFARKFLGADNSMKAVRYPELKELESLTEDEKVLAYFKALINKDGDMQAANVFKALTEGTAADGGYLVPTPIFNRVWEILPDMSVMRRIASMIPMTSQTLKLNSLTGRPVAYWIDEYASKTTTSAEFAQRTLTAYKLVALMGGTHELIQDANIDLVQWIIQKFAEAIAIAEDKAFFTGNGTTQPTGINQETLSSLSVGASLDFDDVISLISLVPQAARRSPKAGFVANREAIDLLRKVKDNDGGYIWRMGSTGRIDGQTERLPDTIYGYPIYEQNDLSGDEIYFGDWGQYIIGDRKSMTVNTTDIGGNAWRQDSTEIKAVERVGGIAAQTTPFAKLTNV